MIVITQQRTYIPGMVVACGDMGESFIVEHTAWYVDDDLKKEVIDGGFSVYGIGYIFSD